MILKLSLFCFLLVKVEKYTYSLALFLYFQTGASVVQLLVLYTISIDVHDLRTSTIEL